MPIITFIGAMLMASFLESAIRYGLNAIRAKCERRDAEREERLLRNRYFQINAELTGCAEI